MLENFTTVKLKMRKKRPKQESNTRKNAIKRLDTNDRDLFIYYYNRGQHTLKDLCRMFDITYYQAKKEIQEYQERKRKYGRL